MTDATPHGLAVSCRGLVQVYRSGGNEVVALAGVDLEVDAGSQLAVVGPSGSGKSSLVGLLAGLAKPTAGQVRVGPFDITAMTEVELLAMRSSEVGIVVQNPLRNLVPYGSAEDNIRFAQREGRRRRPLGASELPDPRQLLDDLGLADLVGATVARLSGGEQQRVSVAVAVAMNPGLVLADEPTSQLDARSRDRVVELLVRVAKRIGSTLVVVTHDPLVASALGRVATMVDGRLSPLGAPMAPAVDPIVVTPPDGPGEGPDTALVADGVSYIRGGRTVLDAVSLRARTGEVVALLGPSGSGKSSLLAVLAGLEAPDAGAVTTSGVPVTGVPRYFALVLQGYGLVGMLTAAENVAVALQARGVEPTDVRARTAAALAEVGLDEVSDHLVDELSGGQQQRVALARALITRPRVLLADEMTAELDHDWKQRLLDLVFEQAARGALVVLATHDEQTARRCTRRVYLREGRLGSAPDRASESG